MPKKVLPNKLEYKDFIVSLKKMGYVRLGSMEEKRELKRLGISLDDPPRQQDVIDDVFIRYAYNGYRAKIRTTISFSSSGNITVADNDSAWALIEDPGKNSDNKAIYYMSPTNRTKNFLQNLLYRAHIIALMIENRPSCSSCNRDMHLVKIKGTLRDYEWICLSNDKDSHGRVETSVFYAIKPHLSVELKRFITALISKEKYAKSKAFELGKEFGSRIKLRKRWL